MQPIESILTTGLVVLSNKDPTDAYIYLICNVRTTIVVPNNAFINQHH